MIDIGHFLLIAACMSAIYGAIGGAIGAARNNRALIKSAANSVPLMTVLAVGAIASLAYLFLTHDYRYVYVWQTSNNDMPWYYLISAIWGGMAGSMLLWAVLMTVFAGLAVLRLKHLPRDLAKWVTPVLSGASGFFLIVVALLTNPFRLVPNASSAGIAKVLTDGNGLNPLLQNPSMLIHPPLLYSGFTGFSIPFAFCFAALLSGNLSDHWIRVTRRWTLIAWGFLTCGIILGGNWAYIELGWGGFWAWDPVENSSFLPWLTGTAFLHSVMVQERKGMLKVWNVCLAVLTYTLTVFGTFLTRSGIVQSVHAFAETDVGWVFLLYIGVILTAATALIAFRWSALRPERRLESYLSREAAFLFNNLLLLGIAFATFWGVMFPVISEAVVGEKSVVGPPFFNLVNIPLFLGLLFLMGVGPLIAWRKTSFSALRQLFVKPLLCGSVVTLLFVIYEPREIRPAIAFGLCVFVMGTIEGELRRALKVRRQLVGENAGIGIVQLVKRRPRRYGAFLVHTGIVIMAVAITASSAYKIEKDAMIKVGADTTIGRFRLRLDNLGEQTFANYAALNATLIVLNEDGSEVLGTLRPERRVYRRNEETTTEVDMRITPREDLYVALAGLDLTDAVPGAPVDLKTATAIFKIFVNPLQVWLWFGGVVVLLGTLLVIGPLMVEAAAFSPSREYESVTQPLSR